MGGEIRVSCQYRERVGCAMSAESFYLLVIISTPNQRFKLQKRRQLFSRARRHEINVTTNW